ncbi:MAG TPA: class I SAM-dependent methyltransferase, partial [Nitrolancea sp.]|nr:class I SAM-dependent methyltransferase [Nitrolancea sp.]
AFRLVRCRRCELRYLNPRPAVEALDRYYPATYDPFSRRGLSARIKARQYRRTVDELWPLLAPPARVLDLGCATGDLLQAVRERGNPNVLGIEPSTHAASIARERYGLDVRAGQLADAAIPDASLDAVLMSHVIEHLPSPTRTLTEIARILRPGGTVVLWLPSADSLAARFLGDAWMGYDTPRHLYTFTPATLTTLLQRTGFVVREIQHEWIGLEWSWGLRLCARERWNSEAVEWLLALLHPALTAAFTPLSAAAALTRKAGRIRVIARRRVM